jgi:hypothetical protein
MTGYIIGVGEVGLYDRLYNRCGRSKVLYTVFWTNGEFEYKGAVGGMLTASFVFFSKKNLWK